MKIGESDIKKRNNAALFGDLHILPFAKLSVELDWPCQ